MLRRWLGAIGLGRRELVCWAAYDWANSAFYTTIVAAVFPIYFTSVACDGHPAALDRYTWATSISIAASAVLGPILGAIADVRAWKRLLLGVFTGLGVVATCGL